ncbi:MAG TPA: hypothetical protein VG406_08935 [Isosphaeraceae bacterium]|nr:hypothetical protein [Isosphaeraceae bacterium]
MMTTFRRFLCLLATGLAVLTALPMRGRAASCPAGTASKSCCVVKAVPCGCCRSAAPAIAERVKSPSCDANCEASPGCSCRADAPAAPGTKSERPRSGGPPDPSKLPASPRCEIFTRPASPLADPARSAPLSRCPIYLRHAHLII